jgi:hypothetical protein
MAFGLHPDEDDLPAVGSASDPFLYQNE